MGCLPTVVTLNGAGTAAATGAGFRIHEVVQIVLDQNCDPRIDFLRLTCFEAAFGNQAGGEIAPVSRVVLVWSRIR